MSLTGATIGVDKPLLTSMLHDVSTLDRLSGGSGGGDTRITRSCDIATDEFRSAAIKGGYSSTDLDALTSTTLHVRWREYIGAIALDDLAVGIGIPEDIRKRCDEARKRMSFLATGAETIDGLTRGTATTGSQARVSAPDSLIFDSGSDTNVTPMRRRDPSI